MHVIVIVSTISIINPHPLCLLIPASSAGLPPPRSRSLARDPFLPTPPARPLFTRARLAPSLPPVRCSLLSPIASESGRALTEPHGACSAVRPKSIQTLAGPSEPQAAGSFAPACLRQLLFPTPNSHCSSAHPALRLRQARSRDPQYLPHSPPSLSCASRNIPGLL